MAPTGRGRDKTIIKPAREFCQNLMGAKAIQEDKIKLTVPALGFTAKLTAMLISVKRDYSKKRELR